MNFSFPNKVALITGGASGLGRATALAFGQADAKVVVSDVSEEGGQETVEMIRSAGGEATFVRTDVTNPTEVADLVRSAVHAYGRIDFALNNAGIGGPMMPMHEYPDDAWRTVLDVNLSGVWYCMKYEIQQMLEQGGGSIVNLASIAGLIGAPRLSAYAASKHAVVGLTKTVALEYVRQGIRINAICPGWTDTPMVRDPTAEDKTLTDRLTAGVPARRLGKPEEMAAAVLYLCSEESAFMVGHAMVLDGGIVAG